MSQTAPFVTLPIDYIQREIGIAVQSHAPLTEDYMARLDCLFQRLTKEEVLTLPVELMTEAVMRVLFGENEAFEAGSR